MDGYGEGQSVFSAFFSQITREGVYTEKDLGPFLDSNMSQEHYLNQYFRNVISVKVALPGLLNRYVNVLMSGDDEFSLHDYDFLDGLVRQFLQQRGELNYDRGQSLAASAS